MTKRSGLVLADDCHLFGSDGAPHGPAFFLGRPAPHSGVLAVARAHWRHSALTGHVAHTALAASTGVAAIVWSFARLFVPGDWPEGPRRAE